MITLNSSINYDANYIPFSQTALLDKARDLLEGGRKEIIEVCDGGAVIAYVSPH
jgi:hypothetical protein